MKPRLPEGHTVRYHHERFMKPLFPGRLKPGSVLSEKGGVTRATVFDPDGKVVAVGFSRCHTKDNFNKRIGRDISLGRALKMMRRMAEARAERDAANTNEEVSDS